MVKRGHPLGPYLRDNPSGPIGPGEGEHSPPRGPRPLNSPNASPRIQTRVKELGEEWGYQLGTALLVKLYCLLFSDNEPFDNNTQSNQMHTFQADRKT